MVMTVTKKYHVGVSYANEDQDIVKSVVKALESVGLTVFFDQKEATQLVGKNLTYTLPEIYRNCCEYCLMFVSNSYVSKKWTTYERDWLLDKRIELQKNDVFTDCVIPVFIDRMDMPGLNPGIVGFDIKKQSPDDIARIMYEKIAGSEAHITAEPRLQPFPCRTLYNADRREEAGYWRRNGILYCLLAFRSQRSSS